MQISKEPEKDRAQYNLQTDVDSKHSLIVNYEVSWDVVDIDHLSKITIIAKETLKTEKKVFANAGYYDSLDIKRSQDNEIISYAPILAQKISKKKNVHLL
ncbi:MAG: hypothetical protein WHS65_12955 [Melioribacteraceae bacterium]